MRCLFRGVAYLIFGCLMLNVCAFILAGGMRAPYPRSSAPNALMPNSTAPLPADTPQDSPTDSGAASSADVSAADAIAFDQQQNSSRDVYLINPDGSGTRQLTHDGASSSPDWSPAHRQIAYTSRQNDVADIYVMNVDGSGVRQITRDNGTDNDYPSWSPDSQQIAFVSNVSGKSDIWVVSASGGKARQLTRDAAADAQSPAWSPDGQQIAYATNHDHHLEIYLMSADGSHSRRLTKGTVDSDSPAWSPDGQQIAYVSTDGGEASIYLITLSSGSTTHLFDITGFVGALSWSPNAKSIAYTMTDGKKVRTIRIMDVSDPTKTSQLTDAGVQASGVSWSAPQPITAASINTGGASAATSAAIPTLDGVVLQITHSGTRLSAHSAASASASVVRVLYWGDRVLWKQKRVNGFLEVSLANGQKAYILDKPEYVSQLDPAVTTPGLQINARVVINAFGSGSHLVSQPSTQAQQVQLLKQGNTLTVIGGPLYAEYYEWWQLRLPDGSTGWHVDISEWWQLQP